MSGIRIFNAAYQQYQESQKNLASIEEARRKREQEDDLFKIKKQKALLDLEEKQYDNSLTKNDLLIQEAQTNNYLKSLEAINKGKDAVLNMTEESEYKKLKMSEGLMTNLTKTNPVVQQALVEGYSPELLTHSVPVRRGKHYSFQPFKNRASVSAIDKALGEIENGVDEENNALQTRAGYEALANKKLGYGWKTKYPQAKNIIDSKVGPDPKEFDDIVKKNNIKTARQAVKFLIDNYGMSNEDAIKFVK